MGADSRGIEQQTYALPTRTTAYPLSRLLHLSADSSFYFDIRNTAAPSTTGTRRSRQRKAHRFRPAIPHQPPAVYHRNDKQSAKSRHSCSLRSRKPFLARSSHKHCSIQSEALITNDLFGQSRAERPHNVWFKRTRFMCRVKQPAELFTDESYQIKFCLFTVSNRHLLPQWSQT